MALNYEEVYQNPSGKVRPKTSRKTVKKQVAIGLTRIEKIIYSAMVFVLVMVAIAMLSLKQDSYALQQDIQSVQYESSVQHETNDELVTEIHNLSSYDRIREHANAMGLDVNHSNIKVVEKHGEAK
ncbi:cell division protein FtsL [Abyssicoccus albus]|uniref:cell division protein FtsL n=1 Tax=Abyssicoccus albus TaxID=1817405 RepID=UPI00097E21D0|nr:cell division protein FtsL [Abyssicoccus albus]AQL56379.1 cell division protein FtsL [Abyssicoccus albus]